MNKGGGAISQEGSKVKLESRLAHNARRAKIDSPRSFATSTKPCVLIFAGNDPSGGAGLAADLQAVAAQGAHPLPIVTAITVQDNDRVLAVHPIDAELVLQQAQTIANKITIHAIKIGIIASRENALRLANWISDFKQTHPKLPVVLDPVLASGHGDALAVDNMVDAIRPLLRVATLITPNLPEAVQLCPELSPTASSTIEQARQLMDYGAHDILIKGGHGDSDIITNTWFQHKQQMRWQWPRYAGMFHGSGCTLASAIAGQLACGQNMQQALETAQSYCAQSLQHAYAIATGQLIPERLP